MTIKCMRFFSEFFEDFFWSISPMTMKALIKSIWDEIKLPYYFMTDMDEFFRKTSPGAEDVRIVECKDGMYRPQARYGGEWKFVTWEGIDLCSTTVDKAKKNAQRFISRNAFPELEDPKWEVKFVVT